MKYCLKCGYPNRIPDQSSRMLRKYKYATIGRIGWWLRRMAVGFYAFTFFFCCCCFDVKIAHIGDLTDKIEMNIHTKVYCIIAILWFRINSSPQCECVFYANVSARVILSVIPRSALHSMQNLDVVELFLIATCSQCYIENVWCSVLHWWMLRALQIVRNSMYFILMIRIWDIFCWLLVENGWKLKYKILQLKSS